MSNPDYQAAVCYAQAGNPAQARRTLAQLEAEASKRCVDHANMVELHGALGAAMRRSRRSSSLQNPLAALAARVVRCEVEAAAR